MTVHWPVGLSVHDDRVEKYETHIKDAVVMIFFVSEGMDKGSMLLPTHS